MKKKSKSRKKQTRALTESLQKKRPSESGDHQSESGLENHPEKTPSKKDRSELPQFGDKKPETLLEAGVNKVKSFFTFKTRINANEPAQLPEAPRDVPVEPKLEPVLLEAEVDPPLAEAPQVHTAVEPAETPSESTETVPESESAALTTALESSPAELPSTPTAPANSSQEIESEGPGEIAADSTAAMDSSNPQAETAAEPEEIIDPPKAQSRDSKKTTVRWQSAAARLTGTSHWRSDLPCQDFALAQCRPRPFAIACDGRGSSARSELGSQAVAQATQRIVYEADLLLKRLLDHDSSDSPPLLGIFLDLITRAWAGALADSADNANVDDKEVETTANLIIVGQRKTLLLQVGDGAVVGIQEKTASRLLEPTRGEYASETVFVTTHPLRPDSLQYRLEQTEDWRGFAAMTDGVSDSLVRHSDGCADGLAQFLSKTLAPAEDRKKAALDLLLDQRVFPTRFTDDRSLAIVFKPCDSEANKRDR